MQEQRDLEVAEKKRKAQEELRQRVADELAAEEAAQPMLKSKVPMEKVVGKAEQRLEPEEFINRLISAKRVVVFSRSWCAFSR